MESLRDIIEFRERKADIHYSLPKDGSRDSNQGTVDVELAGTQDIIFNEQLFEFMSKYGEIRKLRDNPNSPQ